MLKSARATVLLALVSLTAASNFAEAKEFRLLLTSFDPFGTSQKNNTQAVVAQLSKMATAMGSEVSVRTCNLPVVYDGGASAAMDCVNRYSPDAVISLGEAACSLQIETAASNWDDTPKFSDNSGRVREGLVIISGGPSRVGFEFPVQAMYCALDSTSPFVKVSHDPGAFVCNNTAYRLSGALQAKKIPFTFIHVPNTRCAQSQVDPFTNASVIAKMIKVAISEIRSRSLVAMPATQAQADAFFLALKSEKAPACEITFAQKLSTSYIGVKH